MFPFPVLCKEIWRGLPGPPLTPASGNTGTALAAIGRALRHPGVIYMPDWKSREPVRLIESFVWLNLRR
jgi:hypothetical protein